MTENGDPLENAITERVNGIIKNEWIDKAHLQSWGKTMKYVEKVIGLYNKNARTHIKRLTCRTICFNWKAIMLYMMLKIYVWG